MSDVGLFFVRLPTLNQAEVIHAGWAHRDRQNLSLLDACQADTRDALLLDVVEIKAYLTGAPSGGKGPSFADRARKQQEAEVRRAKSARKEMFSSPDGLLIDAGSSHKPPSGEKKVSKSKGSSFTTATGDQSKCKFPAYLAA